MQEKLSLNPQKLNDIEYNYRTIEENISRCALADGRKREDIIFLSATKTVDVAYINYAISLGLSYIGENKVQELLSKYEHYDLAHSSLHFIGHMQSNKIRQIVDKVDMIQSIDNIRLIQELSRQGKKRQKTMDILLEVNIGREESKSGVFPEQLEELCYEASQAEYVKVRGLMTIPPICEDSQKISAYFSQMHKLFVDIKGKNMDNIDMTYLSMGMSSDYEEAIRCGANMVRIGSSLFGERIYK